MTFSIAVAGKGGSGKTSLTSMIIRYLKNNELGPILAVDADPNANLGESLGLDVGQTVGSIIASFNNDKINIPLNLSLNPSTNVTISGWFKLDSAYSSSSSTSLLLLEKFTSNDQDMAIKSNREHMKSTSKISTLSSLCTAKNSEVILQIKIRNSNLPQMQNYNNPTSKIQDIKMTRYKDNSTFTTMAFSRKLCKRNTKLNQNYYLVPL